MQVIGHRGVIGEGQPPENSLAAVERAIRSGADGVEVDVRLTRDGVPVCVHDVDLSRVAGLPWLVDRTVFQQLQHVRMPGEQPVAALRDVVDLVSRTGSSLILDLKPAGRRNVELAQAVARTIPTTTRGSVVASSRELVILDAVAGALPSVARALVTGPELSLVDAVRLASKRGLDLHAHVQELLADAGTAQQAMTLGLVVRAWTVNRPVDAELLRVLGVAAVISDCPEAIRPVPAVVGTFGDRSARRTS